jgi:hypothetical protein
MTLDAQEQWVVDTVDRVGWAIMQIHPNKGDEDPKWFAYTVGLTVTRGWSELICFGLPLDMMTELLNNAVRELENKGIRPTLELELTEVAEGFAMRLGDFPRRFYREHLGWAAWFAVHRDLKSENFGCMQLLRPDKQGRFPLDADCNPEVRKLQTPADHLQ